jgi:hypothetical protein
MKNSKFWFILVILVMAALFVATLKMKNDEDAAQARIYNHSEIMPNDTSGG